MCIIKPALKEQRLTSCSQAEVGWEAQSLSQSEKKIMMVIVSVFMPTLSLTPNWIMVWGYKKKQKLFMWNRNGLQLKDECSVTAHKPKPDWQRAGRNLSPFHVKLEGGSSKTARLVLVSHFQNNHSHRSSEESSRAHQPGKTSNRWRIKPYFTKGAGRLRKLI